MSDRRESGDVLAVEPSASPSPVATLFPGYFALVMATGIVAIALEQQEWSWLAQVLYGIAAVGYVVLTVMLGIRIARYWSLFLADATDHAKGFAFLTTVAGTNVLGAASGIIHGWWDLTVILWWIGVACWVVFIYIALISVVILDGKPGLENGINGTWFLLTVATQSIAVSGALLLPMHPSEGLAFTVLACFALGIVLYLIVMTMVFLRWSFTKLEATEVDPPAWIAAGAVAITVLAGSNILIAADVSDRVELLVPFVEGMVVLAWATATFWFPLMVAIGVWRHLVERVPLRYHPSYWSLVFPIGMYSASTFRMRQALDLEILAWLPKLALAGAFVAWSATAFGLVHLGVASARKRLAR